MARGPLGLSEGEWWDAWPAKIGSMIRNWRNIEIGKCKLATHIANGGEVEIDEGENAGQGQECDARFL